MSSTQTQRVTLRLPASSYKKRGFFQEFAKKKKSKTKMVDPAAEVEFDPLTHSTTWTGIVQ